MHPKPTNDQFDYPVRVGNAIDALDRRLKGNLLDNGAFQVWQRGTSVAFAASAMWGADRWGIWRAGFATGATCSRQSGDSARHCARVQRDSGNASTARVHLTQTMATEESYQARGKYVSIKFRARKGANYSSAADALSVQLLSGTGTDQSYVGSSLTGQVSEITSVKVLTTSWQDFEVLATVIEANATQLALDFYYDPVGTAGAADYFEVEQVQLVIGEFCGDFPYEPYSDVLRQCQRFLPAFHASSTQSFVPGGGPALSTTQAMMVISLPVTARAAPTGIVVSNVAHFSLSTGAGGVAGTNIVFNVGSFAAGVVTVTVAAGLTAGNALALYFDDAAGYLLFTGAEI